MFLCLFVFALKRLMFLFSSQKYLQRFSWGIFFYPRRIIRNNLQFWESVPRGGDRLPYCRLIPQLPIPYSLEASSSVAGFARTNISTFSDIASTFRCPLVSLPQLSFLAILFKILQTICTSAYFHWTLWQNCVFRVSDAWRQYCCGGSLQVAGEELPRKEEAICDILTLLRKFCN